MSRDTHHNYEVPFEFKVDNVSDSDYDTKERILCPWCSADNTDDWHECFTEKDTWNNMDCHECGKDFEFNVRMVIQGGEYRSDDGFCVRVPPCKGGHHHHVQTRWLSTTDYKNGDWVPAPREDWNSVHMTACVLCGDEKFNHPHIKTQAQIPWRDEWNAPAFFDPDGLLKGSKEDLGLKCLECFEINPTEQCISKDDDFPDETYLECPACLQEKLRPATVLDLPYKEPKVLTAALQAIDQRDRDTRWYYESMRSVSFSKREKPKHLAYKPYQPVNVRAEVETIVAKVKADRAEALSFSREEQLKKARQFGELYGMGGPRAAALALRETIKITRPPLSEREVFSGGRASGKSFEAARRAMAGCSVEDAEKALRKFGRALNTDKRPFAIGSADLAYSSGRNYLKSMEELEKSTKFWNNVFTVMLLASLLCICFVLSGCTSLDTNKPYSTFTKDSLYNGGSNRATERKRLNGTVKTKSTTVNTKTTLPCETIFYVQDKKIVDYKCVNEDK